MLNGAKATAGREAIVGPFVGATVGEVESVLLRERRYLPKFSSD